MEYTITIQNNTGDANQAYRYIAFGLPHVTNATRGATGMPTVFYRSRLLNDGEPVTFTISMDVFGFIGNATQTNADLTEGANVSLTKPLPVTLGGRAGNGTELEAKPNAARTSVEFKTAGSAQSPVGTFSIIVNNAIKDNNPYVVGLARKIDGEHEPVAVFGLHPGQTFDITPMESFYIARDSTYAMNTVVKPETFAVKQQVELIPDQPRVTVTNVPIAPLAAGAPAPATGAPSTVSPSGFKLRYR